MDSWISASQYCSRATVRHLAQDQPLREAVGHSSHSLLKAKLAAWGIKVAEDGAKRALGFQFGYGGAGNRFNLLHIQGSGVYPLLTQISRPIPGKGSCLKSQGKSRIQHPYWPPGDCGAGPLIRSTSLHSDRSLVFPPSPRPSGQTDCCQAIGE